MPTLLEELAADGLDPKVAEELLKNPKVAARFEGNLRQSDYDRKMNAGKAEIEAEKARMADQAKALEQARDRMNEQYTAALGEREKQALEVARLREKAKSMTGIYGIDFEKQLFDGQTPAAPPAPATPPADQNKAILDRLAALEDLFKTNVNFETQLHDIGRQHDELFPDKPLDFKALLAESLKQRRTPIEVWDDMFGAQAKRQEITAEKFREEGRKQAREEMEKRISQGAVNPLKPAPPISPIFKVAGVRDASTPNDKMGRRNAAIQAAVEAFTSGKYAAQAPAGGGQR